MANSNKTIGNSFEKDLCESLAGYGFWAHNMVQGASGQPFDVIACRNDHVYAIDCKVCEKNRFPLERIEENQMLSMRKWKDCKCGTGWFALRLENGEVFMISDLTLEVVGLLKRSLSEQDIRTQGTSLGEWVAKCK